jgi:hypothetical protein
VRIPTFSRQSDTTTEDESPTVANSTTPPVHGRTDPPPPPPPRASGTVTRPTEATTTEFATPKVDDRAAANRDANVDMARLRADQARVDAGTTEERVPVVAGPKPRSSMLATLGLIFAVASALLVLSGPLLGYGIGVAGLALVLSLAGIHATGRRHVAGKTDALIGMVLALGAIVVGVLALTGSLSWAGTDIQPVSNLREWLDTQFGNRF